LYSVSSDDGVRNWGPELRVDKQRNNGGGVSRLRDGSTHGSAAVSGEPSGFNAHLMVSNSKISNSDALAKLLRNPNLIRPSFVESPSVTHNKEHTNKEHLMEEKSDVIITNKSKRSREITCNDDQQLEENGQHQLSKVGSVTTSATTSHQTITKNGSSNTRTHTPMEVTQSRHFLSAGPGSQACRES